MEFKQVGLTYRGKKIILDLKLCKFFNRAIGLTFTRKEKARALLFDFKKSGNRAIHSLFVFFDFIGIWIDEEGKIVEVKIIKPWTFSVSPSRNYKRLIEIPISKKYSKITDLFVGSPSKIQKI
jgi:uncharacterized membrane protein (UPF0127 family)